MTIQTRKYAAGTQMTVSYPWGLNIAAKAICPDGKVRALKRIAQTADTFFSIPASVTAKGKSVSGYVTFVDVNNPDCSTRQDNTELAVVFHPVDTSRNADKVFPKKPFVTLSQFEFNAGYGFGMSKSKLERF
jgi:hypothetical protein